MNLAASEALSSWEFIFLNGWFVIERSRVRISWAAPLKSIGYAKKDARTGVFFTSYPYLYPYSFRSKYRSGIFCEETCEVNNAVAKRQIVYYYEGCKFESYLREPVKSTS